MGAFNKKMVLVGAFPEWLSALLSFQHCDHLAIAFGLYSEQSSANAT